MLGRPSSKAAAMMMNPTRSFVFIMFLSYGAFCLSGVLFHC